MRPVRVLATLALVSTSSAWAEVQVRHTEGRLDVQATSAPLAEVLDRIARQTGMKIVYDGAPPRPIVSVTMQGRTQVEAIFGLLEGLGLNYGLRMDATGTRVETLLMMAGSSGGPARPATVATPPIATAPPPEAEEPEDDEPPPPEVEIPGPQQVPQPGGVPQPGAPGPQNPQPNAPNTAPQGPGGVLAPPAQRIDPPPNPAFSTSPFPSINPVIVPQPTQPTPTPTPTPTNQF